MTAAEDPNRPFFAFEFGQLVKVLEINRPATILARCDRGTYREYRLVFWLEGVRNDVWLLESELSAVV